jgi:hypothetical protein
LTPVGANKGKYQPASALLASINWSGITEVVGMSIAASVVGILNEFVNDDA